ncbi:glycoside hydrolase family 127 protein [uncultured Bacteroides sp.]|uniref:glycoside hydrolase family 127 protein n=1 Tax=uncultured Bacteroides sp. TaxID=162156 RepID=UPI002AA8BB45|nr:glycoside hydrolase family 127 protein [uncultured Bacteroides sp.]
MMFSVLLLGQYTLVKGQTAQVQEQVEAFPLSKVRLLDSPFKHAEDLDIDYLLALNADRLLAPYLKEAGLTPKAPNYTNWENTGLDGHIGGHYLSALSAMYASTGDVRVKKRLDYMLNELKRCQDASGDGYLCGVPGGKAMWQEISKGDIRASSFELNGKWVPLYNIHKIYEGLLDAYLRAGSAEARDMLIKLTDWMSNIVSGLSDEQVQEMLRSEHGGLNEIFADVAAITGNNNYLKLAHRFSHNEILQPLLQQKDQLTGLHANTQIPKVIGFERIAEVEGNKDWHQAASFFWKTVVNNRSVSIGGNSVREHFNPADDFSSMMHDVQGPETCNTYNMLRLTKLLYQVNPNSKYIDYYERALYNHILSTQDAKTGGLVYFTPMRSGHYRVYSQPQTSFWCCVGSGMENQAKYGEMIYAHNNKDVYVNLFIPSRLTWTEQNLQIIQKTDFPDKPFTELWINPAKSTSFTLYLRVPQWTKGAATLLVNGEDQKVAVNEEGYMAVARKWKKGDHVNLKLSMSISVESLPDKSSYYSILYGPIVLAAETGTENMKGMFADDSRGGHIASGPQTPLSEMPVIVGTSDQIISHIKPVKGESLAFTLDGLFPQKYNGMKLVPFFRLQECRYMVYWALLSPGKLVKQQGLLAEREHKQMALDSITLDRVICGEQQPETDHFIQYENSQTGFIEDRHWRDAKGWFSYRMKTQQERAKFIYVLYNDEDSSRECNLWINEYKISDIKTEGIAAEPKAIIFPIPENIVDSKLLTVKFGTDSLKSTPRIYEVRILRGDVK